MNYEIIAYEQNSDNWKAWRRNYIGASDAPIIMEVSPWKTPLQLWEEKIEGKETEKTGAMMRGSALEQVARKRINDYHYTEYKAACVQSLLYPWMIASLDGWDETAKLPLLEIKCPNQETHKLARQGEIPDYYYCQMQHQMTVLGIEKSLYVSFDGREGMAEVVIEKNEEYCKELLKKEKEFYDNLLSFEPPKALGRDVVQVEDPMMMVLARSYSTISEKIKNLEEDLADCKKQILSKISHPRCQIGNLKVSRFIKQGNIKYGNIPELRGVDLNKYRGIPVEVWRIS